MSDPIPTDIAIVGAGPVGLMLANMLGAAGLRILLVEALPALIDYPRGVGMDDECLRAFQSIGLVEQILPHVTHHHIMRLTTGSGRVFAEFDPQTDEFGWPRRNAFIQPLIDAILARGLQRYPGVRLLFGRTAHGFEQDDAGVTLRLADQAGTIGTVRARYLVGADGGRSTVRNTLRIPFEGKTDPNRWIVVDIADDPIGSPGAYLHADPRRPYASIQLPHGIRRLEFMLFPGEGEDGVVPRDVLNAMLAHVMPHPERINLIRARIYTHNGRLAASFRQGRVLLAGDAAHIMPVWQGQGYNSGVRDAFNLGWKLARVASGICDPALLDSYGGERREHARAMISLSETVGRVFAVRNPALAALRDTLTWGAQRIPAVRAYFMQMRFKPMPSYQEGALHHGTRGAQGARGTRGTHANLPVGRMFIQPRVARADGWQGRLDDAIGANRFALLCWGTNPRALAGTRGDGRPGRARYRHPVDRADDATGRGSQKSSARRSARRPGSPSEEMVRGPGELGGSAPPGSFRCVELRTASAECAHRGPGPRGASDPDGREGPADARTRRRLSACTASDLPAMPTPQQRADTDDS